MNQIQAQPCENETTTAAQVEAYLGRHPDFFAEHLDLLEQLTIPHPSGPAISLVTKQIELLRNKNRNLQRQLTDLVEIARDNDNLFRRMHQLTLALLETSTLDETLASLEQILHEGFLADFVAVRLIKAEPMPTIGNLFIAPDAPELELFQNILSSNQPKCGRPTSAQAQLLFGESAPEVISCAIVPIAGSGCPGLLAIGSRREDRFRASMGHFFLTQMSEIVGTRFKTLFADNRAAS